MTLASWPDVAVQVDFAHDPMSASYTWVDLTSRTWAFTTNLGRQYELIAVDTGRATLTWRNDDNALDPNNAASPYGNTSIIPYRRVQITATWNGTTYDVYTGLVERWPRTWMTAGTLGQVPAQAVDVQALLANKTLRPCYEQEALVDAPSLFYPLTESAGSTTAGDISGNNQPAASQTSLFYYGIASSGDITFGDATGIPTDDASNVTLNATLTTASSDDYNGLFLQANNVAFTGPGITLEAWITINSTLATALSRNGIPCSVLQLIASDSSSDLLLQVVYNAGAINLYTSLIGAVGPNLNDGHLHHIAMTGDSSHGIVLYVDGASVGTFTGGGFTWTASSGSFSIGGSPYRFGSFGAVIDGLPFRGGLGYVAAYPTVLSAARIAAHYTAGKTAFSGDTADTRIARLLGYAGYTAVTALDSCVTTMQPATDLAGETALDAIQKVADSEGGTFYVERNGQPTYTSRRTRMQTTAAFYVFGDGGGSELPYEDLQYDNDPTYVYNDIQITRTENATAFVSDSTSQGHYGERTYPLTLAINSDTEAVDAANWLLRWYKDVHERIAVLTLNPAANPALWPACLSMRIGTRVTVKRRPPGGSYVVSADHFVEHVQHSVDKKAGKWQTTLVLSPIALQALIADDATFGVCDSTFVAAW